MIYASAATLARRIRDRETSSQEVVQAHLERIEPVNPRLNAVVQVAAEQALHEARAADAALARGELLGPLHGVPLTVKDSIDTAGVVCTGGTHGRRAYPRPGCDGGGAPAAPPARFCWARPIPRADASIETDNLIYGRTNNPYNPAYTPGGSSGGEAALIAAGGSPLGLGVGQRRQHPPAGPRLRHRRPQADHGPRAAHRPLPLDRRHERPAHPNRPAGAPRRRPGAGVVASSPAPTGATQRSSPCRWPTGGPSTCGRCASPSTATTAWSSRPRDGSRPAGGPRAVLWPARRRAWTKPCRRASRKPTTITRGRTGSGPSPLGRTTWDPDGEVTSARSHVERHLLPWDRLRRAMIGFMGSTTT